MTAQARADGCYRMMTADDRHKEQVSRGDFRLPRTRWSHMDNAEFLRFTEFEAASIELVEEMRSRMAELVR